MKSNVVNLWTSVDYIRKSGEQRLITVDIHNSNTDTLKLVEKIELHSFNITFECRKCIFIPALIQI